MRPSRSIALLTALAFTTVVACDDADDTPAVETFPSCEMDFRVDVRSGPNAGMFHEGKLYLIVDDPARPEGFLAPTGREGDAAALIPVTGALADGMMTLVFDLPDGRALTGTGPWSDDAAACAGGFELEGPVTGPDIGDQGDWIGIVIAAFAIVIGGQAGCFAACSYAGNADDTCRERCYLNGKSITPAGD